MRAFLTITADSHGANRATIFDKYALAISESDDYHNEIIVRFSTLTEVVRFRAAVDKWADRYLTDAIIGHDEDTSRDDYEWPEEAAS